MGDPIRFYSSIALEAICYIEQCHLNDKQWMDPTQITVIEGLNAQLPPDFSKRCLGMSTLSLILSAFTDNDLETLSLQSLIDIFKDPNQISEVVRGKIQNEFQRSYVYPMLEWLQNGYADDYVKMLSLLQQIGFEEQYRTEILPLVNAESEKNRKTTDFEKAEKILRDISVMKGGITLSPPKIFVSFFSRPTSFTLYNGSFLTCFIQQSDPDWFLTMIAHEPMHGCASTDAVARYRRYVAGDAYLSEMHRHLIEDFYSGDEEEFVMAAEYYLCLRAGVYSKSKCMEIAKKQYSGVCPTSVILFHLLCQEPALPQDYNAWLIDQFEKENLPQSDIPAYIAAL